jgi:hypothetical protein
MKNGMDRIRNVNNLIVNASFWICRNERIDWLMLRNCVNSCRNKYSHPLDSNGNVIILNSWHSLGFCGTPSLRARRFFLALFPARVEEITWMKLAVNEQHTSSLHESYLNPLSDGLWLPSSIQIMPSNISSINRHFIPVIRPFGISNYIFPYRRRSGYLSALSFPTDHLMAEITRTSTIEKSIAAIQPFDTRNITVWYQWYNRLTSVLRSFDTIEITVWHQLYNRLTSVT